MSSPCLLQLGESPVQQQRPGTATSKTDFLEKKIGSLGPIILLEGDKRHKFQCLLRDY